MYLVNIVYKLSSVLTCMCVLSAVRTHLLLSLQQSLN